MPMIPISIYLEIRPTIRRFSSFLSPLFQSESKYEAFHMEISFIHTQIWFIYTWTKLISIWKASH